jgi:SPP1 family predicted phage head-tail adaptor
MAAGQLRHRIMLRAPSRSTNSIGERVITYADVRATWAKIEPASARESERADRPQHETTHRVTMRYASDVVPGWQFTRGGRTFAIVAVLDAGERRKYLEIEAAEITKA